METNRSCRLEAAAGSVRFVYDELPVPVVGVGEVLVRVEAMSLNFRDLRVRQALVGGTRSSTIPLSDCAGVVEAVGPGVTRWSPGDRVMPGFYREWFSGRFQAPYHQSARGGVTIDGVACRYLRAAEQELVALPDALSFQQGATLPCAGTTAWVALFDRAGLQAGETVLVLGTGGVSILALQIAAAAGARVIVTSSSDEKLDRARALGAWATINYRTLPDWDAEVLAATDGVGVDHILETGGQGTFEKSLKAVAAAGSIAQIGGLAGFGPELNTLRLQVIAATIHGINVGSAAHLSALTQFITENRIDPVVERVYPFGDLATAYDDLEAGRVFGKLVVQF